MTEIQVLRQDSCKLILKFLLFYSMTEIQVLRQIHVDYIVTHKLGVLFYDRDTGIETINAKLLDFWVFSLFYSMTEIQVLRPAAESL